MAAEAVIEHNSPPGSSSIRFNTPQTVDNRDPTREGVY
jgi:hypothetical protein